MSSIITPSKHNNQNSKEDMGGASSMMENGSNKYIWKEDDNAISGDRR